jgi:hypothetical protein
VERKKACFAGAGYDYQGIPDRKRYRQVSLTWAESDITGIPDKKKCRKNLWFRDHMRERGLDTSDLFFQSPKLFLKFFREKMIIKFKGTGKKNIYLPIPMLIV